MSDGRPAWVPEEADVLEDGRYYHENEVAGRLRRRWWRDDGEVDRIEFRSTGGDLLSVWYTHPNGSNVVDFENGYGEISRHDVNEPVVAEGLPEFPSEVVECIRYQLRGADASSETYEVGDVAFFDEDDNAIDAQGAKVKRPPWYA
jgi:hypothetical protein